MTLDGTFAGGKHRASPDWLQVVVALPTWVLLLCYAESVLFGVFFAAWKLLVLELLPLFLTTEILLRSRWILQSLFSPCVLAKLLKKEMQDLVSSIGSSPSPRCSCSAAPTPAGDPQPPQGRGAASTLSGLRRPSQTRGLRARCCEDAPLSMGTSTAQGMGDSELHKPCEVSDTDCRRAVLGCGGLVLVLHGGAAKGWTGTRAPCGHSAYPRHTQPGSGAPSIQQSCGSATGCVRLLGWSPMRRVILKLFLITFSIGGV